jgi:beta-galactosidase
LRTAGKPARLVLAGDSADVALGNGIDDVAYLTAVLVDEAGVRVPDNGTVVSFNATGPGAVIAVDNGNLMDHDPFQATQRKTYEGRAQAIVRANAASGEIRVTASAPGVAPASATIRAVAGVPMVPQRSF